MTTELDPPTGDDQSPVTPERATWSAVIDLRMRRRDFEDKPDPDGVIAHIDELIEALETAQHELKQYRKIKRALAVLKLA